MPRRAVILLLPLLGACGGDTLSRPIELSPGVISRGAEERPAMSPDGITIVFERDRRLMETHDLGNRWSEPSLVTFTRPGFDADPFFSPDGEQLLFASSRPHESRARGREDRDIWSVQRFADGRWGSPHRLEGLNSPFNDRWPAVAGDGSVIFTSGRDDDDDSASNLYMSRPRVDGTYSEPMPIDGLSTPERDEYCAWVSPNGLLMVLSVRDADARSRNVSGDLAVSQRTGDGWSPPRRLGRPGFINTRDYEHNAMITPDGQDLLFSRGGRMFVVPIEQFLTDDEISLLRLRDPTRP